MKLLELIDTKIDMQMAYDTPTDFEARAAIDGKKYFFRAVRIDGEPWDVCFGSRDGDSFSLTGDHVPLKVLSFVREAFSKLVQKRNPELITFSAQMKKAVLYKSLLKRLMPVQYKLSINEVSNETTIFTMAKTN